MPKIRVLIVDDAVVIRRLMTEALASDPEIEVVGVAAHGRIALAKIPQINPDVVTLDVEMPEMDGITTVRELRKTHPDLPVIMFSTLTELGAARTLDALSAGANDYVTKPANIGSVALSLQRLREDLIPKIKQLGRRKETEGAPGPQQAGPALLAPSFSNLPFRPPISLVCIGTSTGGPNALAEVFASIPKLFPAPIVIVQHMPVLFTKMLAERLDKLGSVRFCEGSEGQIIEPGCAYLAPGGRHMEVVRKGGVLQLHLQDGPPENSCRPSVDVLFRSVAETCGATALGVILTGMGQDGLHGSRMLHERRCPIVAQDEATSVVWGMPGQVARAGLATRVLPLREIAPEICRRVASSRQPPISVQPTSALP
ncbi:chemotaxis response regulator protein-glutamate methylesterase [Opitutaceae bacterium EW11]|nr:chemotaxis response regulator protein-glutamate methylesterase [Opitutaceae bacterium EW11]